MKVFAVLCALLAVASAQNVTGTPMPNMNCYNFWNSVTGYGSKSTDCVADFCRNADNGYWNSVTKTCSTGSGPYVNSCSRGSTAASNYRSRISTMRTCLWLHGSRGYYNKYWSCFQDDCVAHQTNCPQVVDRMRICDFPASASTVFGSAALLVAGLVVALF